MTTATNPIENMGSKRKNPNPSGMNAYKGTAKSWCFLCNDEHLADDCPLTQEERTRAIKRRLGL